MAAKDDEVRMEIGFTGGSAVAVSADAAQLDQLESALGGAKGWVTITAKDDTRYLLNIETIVYVRVASLSRSIGFRD